MKSIEERERIALEAMVESTYALRALRTENSRLEAEVDTWKERAIIAEELVDALRENLLLARQRYERKITLIKGSEQDESVSQA
jgi:hypothetical protein